MVEDWAALTMLTWLLCAGSLQRCGAGSDSWVWNQVQKCSRHW